MASVTPASSAAAHSTPGTSLPWAVLVTIRLWSNQGCATAGKFVAHSNCSYFGLDPATCLALPSPPPPPPPPPPLLLLCVTTPPSVLVVLVCVSGTTRLNTLLDSRIFSSFTPIFFRISVWFPVYISFSFCLAFSLFFSFYISPFHSPFNSSLTHFRGVGSYGLSVSTFGTDFQRRRLRPTVWRCFFARNPRIVCVIGKHCV